MNEVFILGAGFSKAISPEMPLLKELSKEVLTHYKHANRIESDVVKMIEDDFEKALTFLVQDKPWLSESENLRHRALYLDLTHVIRAVLHLKSRGSLVWKTNCPLMWLEALITYWHNNRCTVITLNYDTLIERMAGSTHWPARQTPIQTGQLYPIPFTQAGQRGTTLFGGGTPIETFKLYKIHGSTNWFYSGRSNFFGEEIFYVPCIGGVDGVFDADEGKDPEKRDWAKTADKTALIIPPTLDKSDFFQHESLRSMWFQAGQAIREASKITCMGYSLPGSDLTMAHFLKSVAPTPQIRFEIVDVVSKVNHFMTLLSGQSYEFHQDTPRDNCISEFVLNNLIPNEEDRVYARRLS